MDEEENAAEGAGSDAIADERAGDETANPPPATFVFEASVAAAGTADGARFRAWESDASGDGSHREFVTRRALLFRAGDYPDKNVTVTVADLDLLVARFAEDRARNGADAGRTVPVKAEHRDSALDPLGETAALYRWGDALYGLLRFGRGMDAHLRERGALNLSVALVREPEEQGGGFRLKEVSVVLTPRVQGAGFLGEHAHDEAQDAADVLPSEHGAHGGDWRGARQNSGGADGPLRFPFPGGTGSPSRPVPATRAITAAFAQTRDGDVGGAASLKAARRAEPPTTSTAATAASAGETLIRLRASGRLTPAMEPHARALLSLAPFDGSSNTPAPLSPEFAVRFGATSGDDDAASGTNGERIEGAEADEGASQDRMEAAARRYGAVVAFHVAQLLDALPPVQPRAPVLGASLNAAPAFTGSPGDDAASIPDAVRRVAESVGADARRVWRAMAVG